MKRLLCTLALVLAVLALADTARAITVAGPGFAVSVPVYVGPGYVPPPVYYPPAPVYYAPPPVYVGPGYVPPPVWAGPGYRPGPRPGFAPGPVPPRFR
ncbi:hypothetical protein DFW101_3165 [Solidesulfovibrio carbinoliphilus subsp. oakridgensis]|uniref:Virulence factor n=1 Tax=Solidesulfovibrio carbinoliphilus subsp. oakridgensis TaxID=694327 RepID=G7Q9P9_9BACT|nr:hypothetical protein [Solidesulfovibrio carbinoliphilus]EHJ49165.1 hypothetical protein DFW101_3165 [Solidesulfovibrio carbinoliphilus subsp. oakridgensis]